MSSVDDAMLRQFGVEMQPRLVVTERIRKILREYRERSDRALGAKEQAAADKWLVAQVRS